MQNQQLTDYINNRFNEGVDKETINADLLNVGWSPSEINGALLTVFGISQESATRLTKGKIMPSSDSPGSSLSWLWKITISLIFLHLVVLFSGRWGWSLPESIGRLFFLDQEYNVPTLYSSLLFVISGYYCVRFGYANRIRHKLLALTWILLGALLLFLSADEWFGLHEKLIIPLRTYFDIEQGLFYHSWTIAYIGLITIVALISLPWLRSLEHRFRNMLLLSASIYVSGALVLEMVGSWIYSTSGNEYTRIYANIVTLEESLELIGLTLAALTLARYFTHLYNTGSNAPASADRQANWQTTKY